MMGNKAGKLKALVERAIDENKEIYLAIGRKIYQNPETGYKEFETTKTVCDFLEALSFRTEKDIAYTGCRAYTNEGKKGPKIVIMGELDSVICPEHADADKATGAMHACGHNIQVTVMLGVADALRKSGILEELDGKIDFMAVPAEEYIELEYREQLRKEGKIKYFAGKAELVSRGAFDDVAISMMVHNFPITESGFKLAKRNTGNGFIGKTTQFIGKQAHAGAAPWEGVNALNMATLAINSMHYQRETFKESDTVRVHQIITKGGDIVNSVPSDVKLETTVRAGNLEALDDANRKVNQCIRGATISIGGKSVVQDMPGQLPLKADENLAELFGKNALKFYESYQIMNLMQSTASFDMGDLSHLMPVLHGVTSGITGGLHSKDYKVVDETDAFIIPIKIIAFTLIDLLCDEAKVANSIIDNFKPALSKEEYLAYLSEIEKTYVYN